MSKLVIRRKFSLLIVVVSVFLSIFILHRNKQKQDKHDIFAECAMQTATLISNLNEEIPSDEVLINTSSALSKKHTFAKNTVSRITTPTDITAEQKENISDDTLGINVSLDDIPLPSLSSLSYQDEKRAISFFESQHNSWLAIQDGSAQYKTKMRIIRKGRFISKPISSRIGTVEFLVTPLANPIKRQSPAKIQVRLFNDKQKWNFVNGNVFDSEVSSWQWGDNQPSTAESGRAKQINPSFDTELLFFPLDFMAKTYSDGLWNNRYMISKEQYFANQGVPRRQSTQEETKQMFDGEPQYLFMASPALIDAHYWFSAENGELRQIDVFIPEKDLTVSFHYENYIQKGKKTKFPQRLTKTWKKGSGENITGWEYTIELTDTKLNEGISADRFVPPS